MKVKYDTTTITMTRRFRDALQELMAAQCEMMAKAQPDYANCWTWGECRVEDLARTNGLSFTFGGDDDFGRNHKQRFSVVADDGHNPEAK